jgi:hypothetical protein
MIEWLASLPSIPVSTLLLYIFVSVFFLALLPYLIYLAWRSWRRLDDLEVKNRFAARNDFIKTVAQILGGARRSKVHQAKYSANYQEYLRRPDTVLDDPRPRL